MTKWQEVRLRDVCIQITDGTHNTVKDCENGDCYLLSCKNIKNGNIEIGKNERKIDRHTLEELRKRTKTAKGDVLLSSVGTIGETAIIKLENPNYEFQRSVAIFKPNLNFITSEFLYYSLNSRKDILQHSAEGAVQQCLFITPLKDFPISLPPIDVQKKIAGVLGALDDKIELNNRINNNLEQQAQALFKSWFVDKTNPNRKNIKVEEFFNISIGKTPPRKEHEWFSKNPDDIIWVSISDMGNCGTFISNSSEYLTKKAVSKFNIKIVPDNTVLLSFKLTVGRVAITDGNMTTNEAIAHFITGKKEINEYLYCYLKNFNFQTMGSTSSIATAVNSKIIKAMPIVMPTEKELIDFHTVTYPMFLQIKANQQENTRLSALRDTLLPKLMSGEVDVSNVDISALTSADKLSFNEGE